MQVSEQGLRKVLYQKVCWFRVRWKACVVIDADVVVRADRSCVPGWVDVLRADLTRWCVSILCSRCVFVC